MCASPGNNLESKSTEEGAEREDQPQVRPREGTLRWPLQSPHADHGGRDAIDFLPFTFPLIEHLWGAIGREILVIGGHGGASHHPSFCIP